MKNSKGITIVSLIITIIVMVIISGIALLFSAGDERVLSKKVLQTKEEHIDSEIEQKIKLIFSSYSMDADIEEKINNKQIVNKLLNIFEYPNIDEITGLVLGGDEEGTLDKENYTIYSSNGELVIEEKETNNLLLYIEYDKDNNFKFKMIYGQKIYEYNDYKFAIEETNSSNDSSYVGGNIKEWEYTTNEDNTVTLTKYLGVGEQDKENPDILNLTVPNRIKGKVVKTAKIDSTTQLKNINGKLTISPGIEVTSIATTNITKVELKENVTVSGKISGSYITDLYASTGCILKQAPIGGSLINVEFEDNVTVGYRTFSNANKLTEKSVNNILEKAIISNHQVFYKCVFETPINIIIPENSNINNVVFIYCNNINTITIKKGSNILGTTSVNNPIFSISNTTVQKLVVEDNCKVGNLITNGASNNVSVVINEVEIKNNVEITSYGGFLLGITVNKFSIGDNCIVSGDRPIRNLKGLETINIGNNFSIIEDSYSGHWYSNFLSDMPNLKNINIGDNAILRGKIGTNCASFENITIGKNSQLLNLSSASTRGTFVETPSVKKVKLGEGTTIGSSAFRGCKNLETITLDLTQEQKLDNTKIPRDWQSGLKSTTSATITETINESEGYVQWSITYPAA